MSHSCLQRLQSPGGVRETPVGTRWGNWSTEGPRSTPHRFTGAFFFEAEGFQLAELTEVGVVRTRVATE